MFKKILFTKEGRKFYIEDTDRDFHTEYGYISKKDLKKKPGNRIKTNKGKELLVIEPAFIDLYYKISRHAQTINPKDIGLIIAYAGIGKNTKVIDAGSGSGALACFLGNVAKSVVTYDNDDRSIKTTKNNIRLFGLSNVKSKKGDIYSGVKEKNFDVATLDVTEPWKALKSMNRALKIGGFLVTYSPHITQSLNVCNDANENGFYVIMTEETIERKWDVEGLRARPEYRMLGHTGFLTFLRKVNNV